MSATERVQRTFGERVRTLRESKGWQLDDLAHHLNKSRSSMSRIENGKQNLKFMDIVKLAEALDVTVKELFDAHPDLCLLTETSMPADVVRDAWFQMGYRFGFLPQDSPFPGPNYDTLTLGTWLVPVRALAW